MVLIFLLRKSFKRYNVLNEFMFQSQGAFHLSELTGQILAVVIRLSFLMKTIHPD